MNYIPVLKRRNTMYKVQRVYFNYPGRFDTILENLTLEEAQEHCSDPETSSSTCATDEGKMLTKRVGPWFDSYVDM